MRIRAARLTGFRNLADGEIAFSPGVNLLVGSNAQGKTNVLEALNFASLGRSHRGARNEDLIRFDRDHLHVALDIESDRGESILLEYALERGGGRRFKVDGRVVTRRSELVGQLTTVFFQPDSGDLVRGGPDLRRRFADLGLAMIDPPLLGHIAAYQRGLRQKSRLLRELRKGWRDREAAASEVAAWNRELAYHAGPLAQGRREYAAKMAAPAAAAYGFLTGVSASLSLSYSPSPPLCAESLAAPELSAGILREFDYISLDEMRRGRPLIGPHLDDFVVQLDGLDLRTFGSQGETRSAAISLILAQSEVVFQQRRIRPILFLDDIFSELDRERARRLQERCAHEHQVFVATARDDDVAGWRPPDLKAWRVAAGELSEFEIS